MGNLRELTKRLERINFSKPIILTINGKEQKFLTNSAAAIWLQENRNIDYDYSIAMIKSGNLLVDTWDLKNNDIKHRISISKSNKQLLDKFIFHLEKQMDIYNECDINEEIYPGICAMMSIYIAYPEIFNNSRQFLVKAIKDLGDKHFDNIFNCIDYLNEKFKKYSYEDLLISNGSLTAGTLENEIDNTLDTNIPVCLSGNLFEGYINGRATLSGHVITILGYTHDSYYIYDNAIDNKNSVFIDICLHGFIRKYARLYNRYKWNNEKLKKLKVLFNKFNFSELLDLYKNNKSTSELYDYLLPKVFKPLKRNNKFIIVNKSFIFNAFNNCIITYMNPKMKSNQYRSKLWLIDK